MVVAFIALELLQDHHVEPVQTLDVVGCMGFVGGAPAQLVCGAAEFLSHVLDPEGVVFRGVAEMPGMAVSPLLPFVGGVLAVDPSLSFKAAKLDRDICPGP